MKQIVGGSLSDGGEGLHTHFVSDRPASWYAQQYQRDGLRGGHVIQLGAGNEAAAREALAAYPGGLHLGGGVNGDNAKGWLEAGASHVIVTSWVFREGRLDFERVRALVAAVGRARLVLDLSCRLREGRYWVVTDRWQKFTEFEINARELARLAVHCDEFLVHAVDAEGLCGGVDLNLVGRLAEGSPIPVTYAGGARSIHDLEEVSAVGKGRVHLTIGTALDLFGGSGVRYADCVAHNHRLASAV